MGDCWGCPACDVSEVGDRTGSKSTDVPGQAGRGRDRKMPFASVAHREAMPGFLSHIFIWQSSFLIMQPREEKLWATTQTPKAPPPEVEASRVTLLHCLLCVPAEMACGGLATGR